MTGSIGIDHRHHGDSALCTIETPTKFQLPGRHWMFLSTKNPQAILMTEMQPLFQETEDRQTDRQTDGQTDKYLDLLLSHWFEPLSSELNSISRIIQIFSYTTYACLLYSTEGKE